MVFGIKLAWRDARGQKTNMQLQRFVRCSYLVESILLPFGPSWASLFLANRIFENSLSSAPAFAKTGFGGWRWTFVSLKTTECSRMVERDPSIPSKIPWVRLKRSAHCVSLILDPTLHIARVSFSSWTPWLSIQHASSPSSRREWIDLRPQVLSIWHADPSKTRCCEWGDRHILAMDAAGGDRTAPTSI